MKSFIVSAFVIALALSSNALSAKSFDSNNTDEPQNQIEQKVNEKKKEKPTKYDFSLFKFIAPATVQEKDSTNKKIIKSSKELKDETVYENPRAFFRFSYAS